MNKTSFFSLLLLSCVAFGIVAQTPAEVKLIAALDEDRGWCLDLRGAQRNAVTIGGVHGHTCYTYQGNGVALDQGFFVENVYADNEFRMSGFPDKCMTVYEPKAGTFISIESCDDRATQNFTLHDDGRITPDMSPDLCLTLDTLVLPGGGARPLHIMRDVSFYECGSVDPVLQAWELRSEWNGPEETTMPRIWAPGAPNPGGMAAPAGMGAG